ncbi:hypothetical protein [Aneurinibacillus terranovensis]|uniref:hypothetical protein n=1 Tax=Aneurinibacillus terranovensis TaxID=278991 RepID=UPI0003F81DBE|nr:hypothetical protein [Aneurinibacillus terranovensis]
MWATFAFTAFTTIVVYLIAVAMIPRLGKWIFSFPIPSLAAEKNDTEKNSRVKQVELQTGNSQDQLEYVIRNIQWVSLQEGVPVSIRAYDSGSKDLTLPILYHLERDFTGLLQEIHVIQEWVPAKQPQNGEGTAEAEITEAEIEAEAEAKTDAGIEAKTGAAPREVLTWNIDLRT